jgi:hypothetical protein
VHLCVDAAWLQGAAGAASALVVGIVCCLARLSSTKLTGPGDNVCLPPAEPT